MWRAIGALALLAVWLPEQAAAEITRPSAACEAAAAPGTRETGPVFALPPRNERGDPEHTAPRCDVLAMTVAVHNVGRLTEVYDGVDNDLGNADDDADAAARAAQREAALFRDVVERIRDNGNRPLLIYAHGGMVSHDDAIRDAERAAPYMMADGYTPLFLVWTSDPFTSYGNRLCCVRDGYEDTVWQGYFGVTRFFGDLVSGIARAPEAYGKQALRFGDSLLPGISQSAYQLTTTEFRSDWFDEWDNAVGTDGQHLCPRPSDSAAAAWIGATVVFPPYCRNDELNDLHGPISEYHLGYYANTPVRVVTTWAQGLGAGAWDNMVRRTRMPFRASPRVLTLLRDLHGHSDCDQFTLDAARDAYRTPQEQADERHRRQEERPGTILGDFQEDAKAGAFERFFARLECERRTTDYFANLEIHFYGHSMGAIVGDELLRRFPDFNYTRVVYMAAANSIRAFSNGALPVIEQRAMRNHDVEFFNLMLHPMSEARELFMGGIAPQGSLLEWIDEMFEGPRSPDDRVLGKWDNVRHAYEYFPAEAMPHMNFRIFPLQATTLGTPAYARECTALSAVPLHVPEGSPPASITFESPPRCHPTKHGDFNHYTFWRERYLRGHTIAPLPAAP